MSTQDERRWHLDKTFNVGHLITTLTLAVTLGGYVTTMDKRIAVLESQSTIVVSTLKKTQEDQQALAKDIRDELRAIRADLISLVRDRNPGDRR